MSDLLEPRSATTRAVVEAAYRVFGARDIEALLALLVVNIAALSARLVTPAAERSLLEQLDSGSEDSTSA